jgi:hypothetical protein
MRKIFLVLAMVLALAGFYAQVGACTTPACDDYAQATATGGTANATIQKGAIQNSNSNLNVNTNVFSAENTFKPVNTNKQSQEQGQVQGQVQGQKQSVNNGQNISPAQEITISTPQNLLGLPSQWVPQLNFGNGRMKDATGDLPRFAIYGITSLTTEPIMEVLSVTTTRFKSLYKSVLSEAKVMAGNGSKTLKDVRYQIIRAEGQSTFSTGGNIGGGGSALASSGLGGVSAVGSLIPQWGSTTANDRFIIVFVRVGL